MKTTIQYVKRNTIQQFAEEHNLEMEVRERDTFNDFIASFKSGEIKEGAMLCGTYGLGETPQEAIQDYARKISGKHLVIGAYTEERREYIVPNLQTERKTK